MAVRAKPASALLLIWWMMTSISVSTLQGTHWCSTLGGCSMLGSWCPVLSLKLWLQELRSWCSWKAPFGQTGLSVSMHGWEHSLLPTDTQGIKNWALLKHAAKEWHRESYHKRCQKIWPRKRQRELERWAPCSFPNNILKLVIFPEGILFTLGAIQSSSLI